MLSLLDMQIEACPKDKLWVHTVINNYYAVHLILSGHGRFNGQRLSAGDAFIASAGALADYGPDQEDPWTYIWFRMGGTDTENLLEQTIFPAGSTAFSCRPPQGFLETVRCLLDESGIYHPGNQLRDEAAAKLLCSFFRKPPEPSSDENVYVEYAKRQMQERLNDPITIEELASMQFISRKYLSALFLRFTGVSPKQYLSRLRLERAKELLSSTAYSVTDIAHSVGYPDVLAFSRFFRVHTGIAPTAFRANSRDT